MRYILFELQIIGVMGSSCSGEDQLHKELLLEMVDCQDNDLDDNLKVQAFFIVETQTRCSWKALRHQVKPEAQTIAASLRVIVEGTWSR